MNKEAFTADLLQLIAKLEELQNIQIISLQRDQQSPGSLLFSYSKKGILRTDSAGHNFVSKLYIIEGKHGVTLEMAHFSKNVDRIFIWLLNPRDYWNMPVKDLIQIEGAIL